MGSLQIVASKDDYRIFDIDENQMIIKGIHSFRNALSVYERLTSLKESVTQYAPKPHKNHFERIFAQAS